MSTRAITSWGTIVTIADPWGLDTLGKPAAGWVTQDWGVWSVAGIIHRGIDISCGIGTPVYAIDNGKTSYIYPYGRDMPGLTNDGSPGGYGSQVRVGHDWGESRYAHLSHILTWVGDIVNRGDVLGYSGTTGISTGPHLHWEARDREGLSFEPDPYFGSPAKPVPPEPVDEWEEFMASLTEAQKDALVKVANAEINGQVFYAGSPGRTILIKQMDAYKRVPEADRPKVDRRITRLVDRFGEEVSPRPHEQQPDLNGLTYDLSQDV